MRVDTNITDAAQIGDKSKWFEQSLDLIEFEVWDSSSSLNGAIKFLRSNRNRLSFDRNISDSDDELSSKSSNEDDTLNDNVDIGKYLIDLDLNQIPEQCFFKQNQPRQKLIRYLRSFTNHPHCFITKTKPMIL